MKKVLFILINLSSTLFFAQEIKVIENAPLRMPDNIETSHIGEASENFDEIVPLTVLEQIPIFPGCENIPREEAFTCFNAMINKHITKYVAYTNEMLEQQLEGKIHVFFVISKEGKVEDIKARGKNSILQEEAKRVIAHLPQFKPGLFRGNPVRVSYVVPINFKTQ